MRKTLIGLLLLILLAGCIPIEQPKAESKQEAQLGISEFTMREGGSVTVDGKQVRLESYSPDYVCVFDVGGEKREMGNTQDAQIVNGLELTIQKFKYDITDKTQSYVLIKIVKYTPKIDEYLFYLSDEKDILGSKVKLNRIEKDGTIEMKVGTLDPKRIMEGRTEAIGTLYITNVRPNYRAIASERYVIIRVVEKP